MMKKFEKMLLISDYDNTMCYTESALRGGEASRIHPRNLEAIRYWMSEGGVFAMATGRALGAFRGPAADIPMNAPSIIDNGAAIYDLKEERFIVESCLPDACLEHLAAIVKKFPEVSLELYHPDDLIQIVHLTDWNRQHAKLTNMGYEVIPEVTPGLVKLPLVKALLVADMKLLQQIHTYMEKTGWASDYELIFSSDHLLEMTAKGADKGQMALKLKDLCGCEKLYCAGDHANDLPMLRAADRAFAPSNAIPAVLESGGVTAVCHCVDGALGDIVEILDRE